jgi:hypothetical protein
VAVEGAGIQAELARRQQAALGAAPIINRPMARLGRQIRDMLEAAQTQALPNMGPVAGAAQAKWGEMELARPQDRAEMVFRPALLEAP